MDPFSSFSLSVSWVNSPLHRVYFWAAMGRPAEDTQQQPTNKDTMILKTPTNTNGMRRFSKGCEAESCSHRGSLRGKYQTFPSKRSPILFPPLPPTPLCVPLLNGSSLQISVPQILLGHLAGFGVAL